MWYVLLVFGDIAIMIISLKWYGNITKRFCDMHLFVFFFIKNLHIVKTAAHGLVETFCCVAGWFSDNFNFCCIICLYFGISNLKFYPVYTNSFKYIFPDLNTNNAQFGIFTSFWRLFCTNLRMKCHHRHTLVYAYKLLID